MKPRLPAFEAVLRSRSRSYCASSRGGLGCVVPLAARAALCRSSECCSSRGCGFGSETRCALLCERRTPASHLSGTHPWQSGSSRGLLCLKIALSGSRKRRHQRCRLGATAAREPVSGGDQAYPRSAWPQICRLYPCTPTQILVALECASYYAYSKQGRFPAPHPTN